MENCSPSPTDDLPADKRSAHWAPMPTETTFAGVVVVELHQRIDAVALSSSAGTSSNCGTHNSVRKSHNSGNSCTSSIDFKYATPAVAAGAALEADHALHGGHVPVAPLAEIVFEVHKFFGQLVQVPVFVGLA